MIDPTNFDDKLNLMKPISCLIWGLKDQINQFFSFHLFEQIFWRDLLSGFVY